MSLPTTCQTKLLISSMTWETTNLLAVRSKFRTGETHSFLVYIDQFNLVASHLCRGYAWEDVRNQLWTGPVPALACKSLLGETGDLMKNYLNLKASLSFSHLCSSSSKSYHTFAYVYADTFADAVINAYHPGYLWVFGYISVPTHLQAMCNSSSVHFPTPCRWTSIFVGHGWFIPI